MDTVPVVVPTMVLSIHNRVAHATCVRRVDAQAAPQDDLTSMSDRVSARERTARGRGTATGRAAGEEMIRVRTTRRVERVWQARAAMVVVVVDVVVVGGANAAHGHRLWGGATRCAGKSCAVANPFE